MAEKRYKNDFKKKSTNEKRNVNPTRNREHNKKSFEEKEEKEYYRKEEAPEMRLNKLVASRSKLSRREADKAIEEGRVKIATKVVTNPGAQVKKDVVLFLDNRFLKQDDGEFTVLVYNKGKGELVTHNDPQGRKTIFHVLPTKYRHFLPIGRLDFASEGLILLTDSAEVAQRLMESDIPRTYNVKIDGPLTEPMFEAMREGLVLDDARAGGHEKSHITRMNFAPFLNYKVLKVGAKTSRIRVTITEGQNRELRRFFAAFERKVMDLKRVGFGEVTLDNLPTNKRRYLSKQEYHHLHLFLNDARKEEKK
jgi:23S rRNA pseudouridine2605 synthase